MRRESHNRHAKALGSSYFVRPEEGDEEEGTELEKEAPCDVAPPGDEHRGGARLDLANCTPNGVSRSAAIEENG